MQPPVQISPSSLSDYLEVMSKAVFQSGLSWRVVESKWPGIRDALAGFDPDRVAAITGPELEALLEDQRLIRSRRKLEGVIFNAQRMQELAQQHGSFRTYLRSHGGFEGALQDIRKQFKFMGDAGTYFFLYVVGEDVPPYEEWCASHQRKGR